MPFFFQYRAALRRFFVTNFGYAQHLCCQRHNWCVILIRTKQLKDLPCYLVWDTLYPASLTKHCRCFNSSLNLFSNGKNKHKIAKELVPLKTERRHFSWRQRHARHFQWSIQCWAIGAPKDVRFQLPHPCIVYPQRSATHCEHPQPAAGQTAHQEQEHNHEKNLIIRDKSGNHCC